MVKLSFLIPVYNVEAYLSECVNSILCQEIADFEIILIDDGSTDASSALCDSFAAEYSCVRVIHQKNSGAAAARNTGLALAKGEYIAFVDSDDRIVPGSIKQLLQWMQNGGSDLCFLDAVWFYPDGSKVPIGDQIIREEIRGKDKATVCRHLATRPKFSGSACTKIFRTAFLRKNNLCFPETRRHCEDLAFCLDCILRAESYDALPVLYYEYRQGRSDSVTSTFAERGFYDLFQFIVDTSHKLTVDGQPKNDVCKSMMSVAAYEYVLLIWMYRKLPKTTRLQTKDTVQKHSWVLEYAPQRKFRLVGVLLKTVGFEATSWLLDVYRGHR